MLENDQVETDETMTELENYKRLVKSIEDYAIFLLDTDGIVRTWNKGAEKHKGYKAHEIIGSHFSSFYLPQDQKDKKPEKELELAQQFGRVEDEDWRVRKDGSTFWANVVITALYDDDKNLTGFAKVTRDLTERKKHVDNLNVANRQLRQQHYELERLNASKDEFVSLASHQLRTPATGVKQYLGMILEGFLGEVEPRQLEYIKKAYESNNQQIAIVESLLRIAQMDAGQIELKREYVDATQFITNVVDNFREQLRSRNQDFVLKTNLTLPSLFIDVDHFRMAFENLIDNASKYTQYGGEINVTIENNKHDHIITIQDNGVGIIEDDLPKLFEKFSRIPNKLSAESDGTGLGLYWAERVVALHKGNIDVQSQIDVGTKFIIKLPTGK